MAVHYVQVQPVRTGAFHGLYLLGQSGKIRGQQARRDEDRVLCHASVSRRPLSLPASFKKARSFLNKRPKRLLSLSSFNLSGHGPYLYAGAELKVFWFFSSEKNILKLS
jgi:hypothetical protein